MIFPFNENPDEPVYVCKHLVDDGATLKKVYHLDTPVFAWSFLCAAEPHEKDEIVETTLGQVLADYPEIAQLNETPKNCMMVKGDESGEWFAFLIKDTRK